MKNLKSTFGTLVLLLATLLSACGQEPLQQDPIQRAEIKGVLDTCPHSDKSETAFKELHILREHGPILPSARQRDGLKKFVEQKGYQYWCHDQFRELDYRMTGPIIPTAKRKQADANSAETTEIVSELTAYTTHSRVRVYYSDDMVAWLSGDRKKPIPDGAVMVKEMHPSIESKDHKIDHIDGHAVMVRDSKASKDGWLWYLHYGDKNSAYTLPLEAAQYGNNFCLSCHAAATDQSTFAEWDNLVERNVPTYVSYSKNQPVRSFGTTHGRIPASMFNTLDAEEALTQSATDELTDWNLGACLPKNLVGKDQEYIFGCLMYAPITPPSSDVDNKAFAKWFAKVIDNPVSAATPLPRRLPQDLLHDHLPPSPNKTDWLTASTCYACHDAADLLNGTNAEMTYGLHGHGSDYDDLFPLRLVGNKKRDKIALSQYAEWTGSLMSVSARDPIFRAQLESETHRYPQHASETTELCLSCHAPAGSRADPTLANNLSHTYAEANKAPPENAAFGALARDGVTCIVCHRMTDKNLGKPESYTAHFELGDPTKLNGPYEKDIQVDPMQTALGVTPQFAEHISSSGVCGTCHMVDTPVYDNKGMQTAHEQTTFEEWRNSIYGRQDSAEYKSCQGCHMPYTNPIAPGEKTLGKIANYEDSNFPFVPNRKPAALVDTVERPGYRRHTLVGINLFTMNMFQQFPYLLGSHTFSPTRQFAEIVPPRALATQEAINLARHETVALEVTNTDVKGEMLTFDVVIENKTGHKFPTGVGFRRAFLEVSILDANANQLWCSGCTNDIGVITNSVGTPLSTEVAIDTASHEPDYSVIKNDQEVQIYETRHTNNKGFLTTSFVELNNEVKDNRLLPKGFIFEQSDRFQLQPVAASVADENNPHLDYVTYQIPAAVSKQAVSIRVKMYYQALPPYYLLDRISLLSHGEAAAFPETQRLLHFLLRMSIGDETTHASAAIDNWKLQVGQSVTMSISKS